MNVPPALSRASEWVLRRDALRDARAAVIPRGNRRDRALCQARLFLEVARRVAEPVEGFPPGSRAAVRLGLYREAAYWALAAGRTDAGDVPSTLAGAWADQDTDRLRRTVPDAAAAAELRRALVDRAGPDPLETTDEDADRALAFVESVIAELDAPRRRVAIAHAHRWLRIAVCAMGVVLIVWGLYRLALGPNQLAGKPFRTSSSFLGCKSDPSCEALLFHTDPELNPWVEFDLGAPKAFHRLEVTNRGDCCAERTIPLIAETSNDRVTWKELARRDTDFSSWTVKFPARTARYLRLRVPRHTTFHLKDVALR